MQKRKTTNKQLSARSGLHRICLLLLLGQFVWAIGGSAQVDFRIIGAAQLIDRTFESDFYIASLVDERAFTANLGIVNRGVGQDIKRPLMAEAAFLPGLERQMNAWLLSKEDAVPVEVKLRELYFWEELRDKDWAGTGYVRLRLAFAVPGEEEREVGVQLSGNQLTVVKGHSPRLEDAFYQCLQRYQESFSRRHLLSASTASESPAARGRLLAAANFLDLRQQRYSALPGNLKRYGKSNLHRYRLSDKRQQNRQYAYALIDDGQWFIRATSYPGWGDYYTRVLERGRYLFLIDKLNVHPKSDMAEQGLNGDSQVGIIIDMQNGLPHLADDEALKRIMAPYPQLQEQYIFQDLLKYPVQLGRVQEIIAAINAIEAE